MNPLPQEILKGLEEYREDLMEILGAIYDEDIHSPEPDKSRDKLRTWEQLFIKFLKNNRLENQAQEFSRKLPTDMDCLDEELINQLERSHVNFIDCLIHAVRKHPEETLSQILKESPNPTTANEVNTVEVLSSKVFIVHGHDEANLYKLRDLLKERYKLDCIIMKFQPGKGRTLIEKFEQEAGDAGFAFILMTPDDLVEIPGKTEQYAQARPNVIFELGWFHGRLGRNRVCILFKKGTQIHSDLAGVSRIEFNESVEEKVLDIERELRAARLIG